MFLEVYDHKDAESATDFLSKCLGFFPFIVKKVLTDNGREFTLEGFKNRYGPAKKAHPFDRLCESEGIEHRRTKPYTPQTNGMAERMNGLTKENTTKKHTYANSEEMVTDLKGWMRRYDFERPHRQLGRKTPYEAVCEWHQKEPQRFVREPSTLLACRSQPPENERSGIHLRIYPGSAVGPGELQNGKPNNPARIQQSLDALQGGKRKPRSQNW
jgi:Integrase core domain